MFVSLMLVSMEIAVLIFSSIPRTRIAVSNDRTTKVES